MRRLGYGVEITTHPTNYGNSVYVSASLAKDGVGITRGFRLSDHEVGDRRKAQDDFPTIIDGRDVTVESLIGRLHIDTGKLDDLAAEAADRKARIAAADAERKAHAEAEKEARRAEEAAHIERLQAWLAEHCPEYETLNKTEKKKVRKQANVALYSQSSPEAP